MGGQLQPARPCCPALPDLFDAEVLERLEPPARAALARTARALRDTVYPLRIFPSGPPRGRQLVGLGTLRA